MEKINKTFFSKLRLEILLGCTGFSVLWEERQISGEDDHDKMMWGAFICSKYVYR